jgi:hypothetical protein
MDLNMAGMVQYKKGDGAIVTTLAEGEAEDTQDIPTAQAEGGQ